MLRGALLFLSGFVVLFASLYQFALKDLLSVTVGLGRVIQPLEDFPFSCRRLEHEQLQGCEDLWLDDEARVIYAACAGSTHRLEWSQGTGNFNISGRRPGGSELIALDIDSPGDDGLYGMRAIKPVGYVGASGDEALDFVGFDAEVVDSSTIRFYFVNERPPVDSEKRYTDPLKFGANSTIEIFELKRGKNKMQHVKTVFSPSVWEPNRVAVLEDGAFAVTNFHGSKHGLRRELDPILGGGNVAYCASSGDCHVATTSKLVFPNGLAKGRDGLIYVPSSADGTIKVFELQADKMLKEVDVIKVGTPMDNLAVDAEGSIYAAAFPDLLKALASFQSPFEKVAPVTVYRIKKTGQGYQVDKVIEDRDSKELSGVTTARHDVKTGNIFLGAALSPYMMVCDLK